MKIRNVLFLLIALSAAPSVFADDAVGTPANGDPAREEAIRDDKHPAVKSETPYSHISNRDKPKGSSKKGKSGGYMPPAGSAATGGTSASPGGAPTTPYGGNP